MTCLSYFRFDLATPYQDNSKNLGIVHLHFKCPQAKFRTQTPVQTKVTRAGSPALNKTVPSDTVSVAQIRSGWETRAGWAKPCHKPAAIKKGGNKSSGNGVEISRLR